MQSTLRSTAAATTVLLASLGALTVATPATAQVRAVVAQALQGQRTAVVADVDRDHGHARFDDRAPRISEVTPAQGDRVSERGRTLITARVHDRGTGVATVSLRVDGVDVSHRLRIEGDHVRYAEDLREGRHRAELTVRDRAGNTSREAWSFEVLDRHHGRRWEDRR